MSKVELSKAEREEKASKEIEKVCEKYGVRLQSSIVPRIVLVAVEEKHDEPGESN
jgi:hypothetical protein